MFSPLETLSQFPHFSQAGISTFKHPNLEIEIKFDAATTEYKCKAYFKDVLDGEFKLDEAQLTALCALT